MAGKWKSTYSPLVTQGLNSFGVAFKGRDLIDALVRESIQNAGDARSKNSTHVRVKFGFSRIEARTLPDSVNMLRIFKRCEDFPSRSKAEREFFKKGQLILNAPGKTMGVLRISDYGTVGLTGAKDCADGGRWKGLVMTMGAGNDDASRGGRFGVGKQAMFISSSLRTIFFSTLAEGEDYAAHMGVSYLATYKDPSFPGNQQASSTVFYCNEGYDQTDAKSVPTIEGQFALADRKAGEYGTDLFIPGFEPKDEEKLSAEIMMEVLKSFMVAVCEGKLVVDLPNGKVVSAETLDDCVDYLKHKFTEKDKGLMLVCELRKLMSLPWKRSKTAVLGVGIDSFPEGAFEYKFIRSDHNFNQCFVSREKGMFVHAIKDVCGTTSALGVCVIRDSALNEAFMLMENERHDAFEVTTGRFPEKEKRELASKRLTQLKTEATKWSEEEVGVVIDELTNAVLPDELDAFIEACAGQFTVQGVKSTGPKKPGALAARKPKRHKHKARKMVQAASAALDDEGTEEQEPGVIHKEGKGGRRKSNVGGSKKHVNPNSPEENGFVMRALQNPVFYASGKASSGKYRFSFKVPHDKAVVCVGFASTAENDRNEPLPVKAVTATCNGAAVVAAPGLNGTAAQFENVAEGTVIDAEIEFDVAHYCYAEVRYYEKKNI